MLYQKLTIVDDHYLVRVHDSVQTMSNCQDSTVFRLFSNKVLNKSVGPVSNKNKLTIILLLTHNYSGFFITPNRCWLWLHPRSICDFEATLLLPDKLFAVAQQKDWFLLLRLENLTNSDSPHHYMLTP